LTLRTSSGVAWRFFAVGGTVTIEDSTYLGATDQPRKSRQIVVSGTTGKQGARIKWALRQEAATAV
jgi:uncharacterized heparinase superfamily protein